MNISTRLAYAAISAFSLFAVMRIGNAQQTLVHSVSDFQDFFPSTKLSDHLENSPFGTHSDASPAGSRPAAGTGAGEATDPSAALAALQFQNTFVPETHNATGFSNLFVIQPVLPFHISEEGPIPYHIIRPTLPIFLPTANPDGSAAVHAGLGDLTILDAYVVPINRLKTKIGIGYVAILPTATHDQLGLGVWQVGPSAVVISKIIPKWNLGVLYQQPFSTQSNAYQINVQPLIVHLLPRNAYVGWGSDFWKVNDNNGNYSIPLQLRLGKVLKGGKHPLNVSVEGHYTPKGLRSGTGGNKWAIKLGVSILMPNVKMADPFLSRLRSASYRQNLLRSP